MRTHKYIVISLIVAIAGALAIALSSPWAPRDSVPGESSSGGLALSSTQVPEALRQKELVKVAVTPTLAANEADAAALSNTVIAKRFDSLLQRAARDPAFAYALVEALDNCAAADKAYATLARNADQPGIRPEKAMAELDNEFAKCSGLSEDQMALRFELVTAAARAGVFEAQLEYMDVMRDAMNSGYATRRPNAVDEIRVNGEAFTLAAARTGNPEALYRASAFYRLGQFVPKDLPKAYRFLRQYQQAMGSNPAQVQLVQSDLDRLFNQMTPEQQSRATTP